MSLHLLKTSETTFNSIVDHRSFFTRKIQIVKVMPFNSIVDHHILTVLVRYIMPNIFQFYSRSSIPLGSVHLIREIHVLSILQQIIKFYRPLDSVSVALQWVISSFNSIVDHLNNLVYSCALRSLTSFQFYSRSSQLRSPYQQAIAQAIFQFYSRSSLNLMLLQQKHSILCLSILQQIIAIFMYHVQRHFWIFIFQFYSRSSVIRVEKPTRHTLPHLSILQQIIHQKSSTPSQNQ